MGIGAAIGGIVSGVAGASSAKSAANAQIEAAEKQIELEREIYGDTTQRFKPYYKSGKKYQKALDFELLGGERPVFGGYNPKIKTRTRSVGGSIGGALGASVGNPFGGQGARGDSTTSDYLKGIINQVVGSGLRTTTEYSVGGRTFDNMKDAKRYRRKIRRPGQEYQGFQATPGYNFMLEEGLNAIDGSAAARGNVFSGATMKAAQDYGTGLANREYNTFLDRLTAGASQGQAAAGNMANAGANYASGAGNALANIGNAGAAGAIGVGNAFTGAINNVAGAWGYMQQPQMNNALAPTSSIRPMARPF